MAEPYKKALEFVSQMRLKEDVFIILTQQFMTVLLWFPAGKVENRFFDSHSCEYLKENETGAALLEFNQMADLDHFLLHYRFPLDKDLLSDIVSESVEQLLIDLLLGDAPILVLSLHFQHENCLSCR